MEDIALPLEFITALLNGKEKYVLEVTHLSKWKNSNIEAT